MVTGKLIKTDNWQRFATKFNIQQAQLKNLVNKSIKVMKKFFKTNFQVIVCLDFISFIS